MAISNATRTSKEHIRPRETHYYGAFCACNANIPLALR